MTFACMFVFQSRISYESHWLHTQDCKGFFFFLETEGGKCFTGVLYHNLPGAEAAGQPGAVAHLWQLQREPSGAAHPARLPEAGPVHAAQPGPAGQKQPLLVAHPSRQQVGQGEGKHSGIHALNRICETRKVLILSRSIV